MVVKGGKVAGLCCHGLSCLVRSSLGRACELSCLGCGRSSGHSLGSASAAQLFTEGNGGIMASGHPPLTLSLLANVTIIYRAPPSCQAKERDGAKSTASDSATRTFPPRTDLQHAVYRCALICFVRCSFLCLSSLSALHNAWAVAWTWSTVPTATQAGLDVIPVTLAHLLVLKQFCLSRRGHSLWMFCSGCTGSQRLIGCHPCIVRGLVPQ